MSGLDSASDPAARGVRGARPRGLRAIDRLFAGFFGASAPTIPRTRARG